MKKNCFCNPVTDAFSYFCSRNKECRAKSIGNNGRKKKNKHEYHQEMHSLGCNKKDNGKNG